MIGLLFTIYCTIDSRLFFLLFLNNVLLFNFVYFFFWFVVFFPRWYIVQMGAVCWVWRQQGPVELQPLLHKGAPFWILPKVL